MTTSRVGTMAMIEKSATSLTCSRPFPPMSERTARRIASRRATITISTIAGTRLTTSMIATASGVSGESGLPVRVITK